MVVMVEKAGVRKAVTRTWNELKEGTVVKIHKPSYWSAGLDRDIYIAWSRGRIILQIWIYAKPGSRR